MTAPRAQVRSSPRFSEYRWNETAGRYIAPSGRFVANDEIRRQLDRTLENTKRYMQELSGELRAGEISLDVWHDEMRVAVKDVQVYSGALARGGWAQLSRADLGRIGQLVQKEYQYLYNFARDIASGRQTLGGGLSNRASLYGEAGRHAYELIRREMMREVGMTRERNQLHPADHCEGIDSCIEQTARGWVEIGSLIPVGERRCGRRCHCTIEYAA